MYFHEGRKPTDLIDKFREARLLIRTLLVTVIITLLYLIVALILNYAPSGRSYLYVLPSMNTSSYSHELINEQDTQAQLDFEQGVNISFYFLTFVVMIESVTFLLTMHQVRDFKEEFNLLNEIKWYALAWLGITNVVLFLMIQGSHS